MRDHHGGIALEDGHGGESIVEGFVSASISEWEEINRSSERRKGIAAAPSKSDETNGKNIHDSNHGSVALVIPWLESQDDRRKLYGTQNTFSNGAQGMKEQEEWKRSYSSKRCGMPREAKELQMIFLSGVLFGWIWEYFSKGWVISCEMWVLCFRFFCEPLGELWMFVFPWPIGTEL